jgi:hypothetical protein
VIIKIIFGITDCSVTVPFWHPDIMNIPKSINWIKGWKREWLVSDWFWK